MLSHEIVQAMALLQMQRFLFKKEATCIMLYLNLFNTYFTVDKCQYKMQICHYSMSIIF